MTINPTVNMIEVIRFRWYVLEESGLFACVMGANRIIGIDEMQSPHRSIVLLSPSMCSSPKNTIYTPIVHI